MSTKTILITGANSGIGYATSKILATASDTFHVIMASRSPEKGQKALDDLKAEPGIRATVSTVQLDVSDQTSIDAAHHEIETKHGGLDVLVNNAGVSSSDSDYITRLQNDLAVNVVGAARVAETFKPLLARSSAAYLVHVASMMGSTNLLYTTDSPADWKSYRVSKAGLLMVGLADAKDAAQHGTGVKVFTVCPGFVVSNLRGTSEEERSGGGHAGDPEDAGRMVLSVINGQRDADVGKFIHKDGVYSW